MIPSQKERASNLNARAFYLLTLSIITGLWVYAELREWVQSGPTGPDAIEALMTLCAALAGTLAYVLIHLLIKSWNGRSYYRE